MNLRCLEIKKKKGWRCRNGPERLLLAFGFGLQHSSQAVEGCWVATRVFLVATELPSSGFLSRQGPFLCPDSVLTMSRQRVPCRVETAEVRGQGCNMSLAGAKEFQVVTKNFNVTTGPQGVVSRQSNSMSGHSWSG